MRFHDVMLLAIFSALHVDQAAAVKAQLRDNIAKMSQTTVPEFVPAEWVQSYRNMLSAMMQVVLAAHPDAEDLARGFNREWLESIRGRTG
jgi:hypothetical protein